MHFTQVVNLTAKKKFISKNEYIESKGTLQYNYESNESHEQSNWMIR